MKIILHKHKELTEQRLARYWKQRDYLGRKEHVRTHCKNCTYLGTRSDQRSHFGNIKFELIFEMVRICMHCFAIRTCDSTTNRKKNEVLHLEFICSFNQKILNCINRFQMLFFYVSINYCILY